jgi:ATP-dependent DNA helicase RecQ
MPAQTGGPHQEAPVAPASSLPGEVYLEASAATVVPIDTRREADVTPTRKFFSMRAPPAAAVTLAAAEEALRQHWDHPAFRPGQREAVEAVLRGEDVLAVLPTGGGKSVCYQVPAIVLGGLTIVVSPLIALMQDQVVGLRARGVPATFINSDLSFREAEQRWTDAEFGRYRLLYLAPERFQTDTFLARADRLPVRLLAVDEAHCISEWGPDFRPAYRRLADAASALGRPPVLAVTATATPEVRHDIAEQLALRQPRVIVRGFDRPNVVLSVFRTSSKADKLRDVLEAVPGSGIVYANTRRGAEDWAARLRAMGATAEPYHAGRPAAERAAVQQRWQEDTTRVISATNAFGMGIDKPDVRFVVHVDVPPSLEAYYQEAGRAGRDGATSYAVALFAESDEDAARSFAEEGRPDARTVQAVYDAALSLAQIALGSHPSGPFVFDVERVAQVTGRSPMAVRAAAEVLVREGILDSVRLPDGRGLIRFLQPADALRRWAEGLENGALSAFVGSLLRGVHAEAFSDWADMDLRALERRAGLRRDRFLRGLDFLAGQGVLAYHAPGESLRFRLIAPRTRQIVLDHRALEGTRRRASRRLDEALGYLRAITCRRRFLLAYFGESSPERCGRCDVCLGRHRPTVVTSEDEAYLRRLLIHIRDGDPQRAWLDGEDLPPYRVAGLADWLVHEGHLRVSDPLSGTFTLTESGRQIMRRVGEEGPEPA